MSDVDHTIALYSQRADEFFANYNTLDPSDFYGPLLTHLPAPPATILDIGAGTGRDAGFFAQRGYHVIAVEPAAGFRERASRVHSHPQIRWLDDRLPLLTTVRAQQLTADAIWLSAVWMHVAPKHRPTAFDGLVSLLGSHAKLMFSLRIGPAPADRPMFATSSAELITLGSQRGLVVHHHSHAGDQQQRPGVHWENLVLARPR